MDKAKKKLLKRYLTWGGIAALVALLTVMPLLARQEAQADGPVASILSAQVTRKDIPQVLHGGGTLEALGETDVNIPTGVKITEFLVKNGETVEKGQPVALVDKVSVMAAITDVTETMEYLREELEDGRNEKVDSTIYATAGGRVKRVFVWPGDDVQDVMLTHGALALLSIDGLMAVKLEVPSPLTTGESVLVKLSGAQVTGRVESNLNHQIIVTVEDEGYAIGETAAVFHLDGTLIGKGELYVHNAWKATGYSGTVSTVSIKEEQVLSSGTAMFTLTDRDYEGQLRRRASQHREYEELLQRLMAMYESGAITAPCGGTVSGVDKDSAHLLSGEEFDAEVTLLGGDDWGNVQLMLLTSVPPAAPCTMDDACLAEKGQHLEGCPRYVCLDADNAGDCKAKTHTKDCIESCQPSKAMFSCDSSKHKAGCITKCAKASEAEKCPNTDAQAHYKDCIKSCTRGTEESGAKACAVKDGANHYADCIESCKEAKSTEDCAATGKHKVTCIRSCTHGNTTAECAKDPKYPHYHDCVQSCTSSDDCLASKHKDTCPLKEMTFTARMAGVDYVGNTVLGVYWDKNPYPVVQGANGWELATPNFTGQEFLTKGELAVDNPKNYQKGDVIMAITGYKGNTAVWDRIVKYSSGGGGAMPGLNFNISLDLKGMMGGFAGFGNYPSEAQAQTENLHDLKGSTLMTVTPDEGIAVDVLLDERDIDKAQVGQKATIRVEAIRGQTFTGQVTKVGAIGTHAGGSGKFQVRVEIDSIPGSLPGMSSMVRIHLKTQESVLTLPVAAVSQDGAKTIVYTALDSKTGEPASPREITTGVSDGETVEVIGLEEGTKVYYSYYDVLEIDDSAKERQFNLN